MRILVMGLPGSGKTTLAKVLAEKLNAVYLNADEIRKQYNDWDFSEEGRLRQAERMSSLTWIAESYEKWSVADFVCPTEDTRRKFDAEFTVFMNTITTGRFEDTNKVFVSPACPDFEITEFGDVDKQTDDIIAHINSGPEFTSNRPTGLMIGRFQPFHDGHKKLFETILEKEGQVLIAVRDTHGLDEKNPFSFNKVARGINAALREYQNKYQIIQIPNITGVYYGRDVGYKVEQIHLGAEIESISATSIRKKMVEQSDTTS